MKKRAVKIGVMLLISGMGYTAAFAADSSCATCTSTSPIIDQYINFSYEIIQTLQTIANEKQQISNTQNMTIYQRIANNLNKKSQTAATFTLATSVIGSKLFPTSVRQEIIIMGQSKALIRDREKLDALDQDIADTLYDMGQAGVFIANVQAYQERISGIFEKYSETEDSFISAEGQPSPRAEILITALRDLNQAYKRFLTRGSTEGFDVFTQRYQGNLGLRLTDINYTKLSEEYSCTRGIAKCEVVYKNFGKNMSEIGKNASEDAKEAVDTIKVSLQRLKCAFSKQSNLKCQEIGFKEKQNDLLRGLYGLEGPMSNRQGSVAIANSMDRLGDSIARQIEDVKEYYAKPEVPNIAIPRAGDLRVLSADGVTQRQGDDIYTQMMKTVNETLSVSKAGWQEQVMADPLVVTRNIPRTSILVYNSINIIGDAQAKKSITQNLGKACENQCSNLGGTCYY